MKKVLLQMLLVTSFVASTVPCQAALDGVVPNLNNAIGGSVNSTSYGLDVNVNGGSGAVGQFDWNSFNVGSDKRVNFGFSNYSQTALNRVIGNDMSQIYGQLTQSSLSATKDFASTGKVILFNPNGIMFGDGANVNLNSFTATTFDPANAKNIKDLSAAELATYQANLKNNFGDGININFSGTASKIGALIKADNAKLNIDKTLILMGKDVEIANGSEITTSLDYNYGNPKNQSFSNVKISAGNGGEVKYQLNGYVMNEDFSANQGLAGVDNNIVIGSDKATDGTTIRSGNIFIKNRGITYDKSDKGGTTGSNIEIKNSYLLADKLINHAYGNIDVVSNNYLDIKNAQIKTYNTYEAGKKDTVNTYNNEGGNIFLNAGAGVDVQDSTLQTAYSLSDNKAGNIYMLSDYGNVNVNNSNVFARGNVDLNAKLNANVTNSLVISDNPQTTFDKNITITGLNEVNVGNSLLDASGNINLLSDKNINIYKNDAVANGIRSIVYAGKDLNIIGADTKIADTNLSYNKLALYDTKENNVTVAGGTTFEDRKNADLTVDVNGKLTLDKATVKKAVVTENSKNTSVGAASNQTKITLNATKGVDVKNSSNVESESDINVNSTKGGFSLLNSIFKAKNDVNVDVNNSFLANGTNMNTASSIDAKNINVKTNGTNSDIELSQAVYDKMAYTGRLNLNAKRNVKADGASVKLNKVDAIAQNGKTTIASSTGDVELTDVTLKAKTNEITSKGNLKVTDLELKSNTAKAEDTITTATADKAITGNIKTNATKLFAKATGDVNLNLAGANNVNAGVEVTGANVALNATDDKLSISRIIANRLNLDENDKFIAAKTTLTASETAGLDQPAQGTNPATPVGDATGRAYIEVKEFGGFNLDKTTFSIDENGNYVGFYTASYVPTIYTDAATGDAVDAYAKHFINLQGETADQPFLLVYTKVDGSQAGGPPVVGPDYTYNEVGVTENNETNIIRIPTPNQIYGLPEPIANTLASATNSLVAAAAGISFGEEDENANEYIQIIE